MLKNKIKYLVVIMGIISIGFGMYHYKTQQTTTSKDEVGYNEVIVKKGDVSIEYLADGNVHIPTIALKFEESGLLKELIVDVGDEVSRGQIIAKLDDKDYINDIRDLEIKYRQALAKLEKSKQQYELDLISDKSKLDNLKYQMDNAYLEYFPMTQVPDTYPQLKIDSQKIIFENLKSAYEAALKTYEILLQGSEDVKLEKINVEQVEEALRLANEKINNTFLKSPVDGLVLFTSTKVGEMVSTNNEFAILATNDPIQIVARVSEFDLSQIEISQKTRIEFEALSGQFFHGRVKSIDPLPIKDASGLVSYNVNIEIEDNENLEKIKDGMSCYIAFILRERENVISIPNMAVSRIDGQQVVEIKDENGNIHSRNIKTGLTDGTKVEVLDGITEGERIIIRDKK